MKFCKCGCEKLVEENKFVNGKLIEYTRGHSSRVVGYDERLKRVEEFKRNAPFCECGCGEKIGVVEHVILKGRIKNYKYSRFCPGHSNRKINVGFVVSGEERDLIVGSCLGDGSIQYPHGTSDYPRLVINHGYIQHRYNLEKEKILKRFGANINIVENGGYGDFNSRLTTSCSPVFKEYFNIFYEKVEKRSRKIICENIYDLLNEKVMAWWYMDDGSISKKSASFHTERYKKDEVFLMSDMIKRKFDILTIPSFTKGKYWYLRMNVEESGKLINIVKPYIFDSMAYKLGKS